MYQDEKLTASQQNFVQSAELPKEQDSLQGQDTEQDKAQDRDAQQKQSKQQENTLSNLLKERLLSHEKKETKEAKEVKEAKEAQDAFNAQDGVTLEEVREVFEPKAFLKTVPNRPGSYRMYDANDVVIYVGKAKDLKKRLSSYFLKHGQSTKTQALVSNIARIEFTVTFSESEALILENELIKRYQPRYNILLRDDKSYPYILLTSKHEHPGIYYHRGAKRRVGEYFGPFPDSNAVKESLRLLQRLFPVRQCEDSVYSHRTRPCLMAQMGRCLAPCVDMTDEKAQHYQEQVSLLRLFLKGQNQKLLQTMVQKMEEHASKLEFEEAALLRDQLTALRRVQESNSIISDVDYPLDVIGHHIQEGMCCVHVLFIRQGRILGSRSFFPKLGGAKDISHILFSFLTQFYLNESHSAMLPDEVLLDCDVQALSKQALLREQAQASLSDQSHKQGQGQTKALDDDSAVLSNNLYTALQATSQDLSDSLSTQLNKGKAGQKVQAQAKCEQAGEHEYEIEHITVSPQEEVAEVEEEVGANAESPSAQLKTTPDTAPDLQVLAEPQFIRLERIDESVDSNSIRALHSEQDGEHSEQDGQGEHSSLKGSDLESSRQGQHGESVVCTKATTKIKAHVSSDTKNTSTLVASDLLTKDMDTLVQATLKDTESRDELGEGLLESESVEAVDLNVLAEALSSKFSKKIRFAWVARGAKSRYVKLATTNAQVALQSKLSSEVTAHQRIEELEKLLGISGIERMECYDISHTMGEHTVASCVVFSREGPDSSRYRRYNITGIKPGDDFAAMHQVLSRRFRDPEQGELPQLIFIDGGKGQLAQAEEVLTKAFARTKKPMPLIIAVTKGEGRKEGLETLVIGFTHDTIKLTLASPALQLVLHIRDESHRFAITGHRAKRDKARTTSKLESIQGVGPKRRQALLQHLGGMQEVLRASIDELKKVPGISAELAAKIYDELHSL